MPPKNPRNPRVSSAAAAAAAAAAVPPVVPAKKEEEREESEEDIDLESLPETTDDESEAESETGEAGEPGEEGETGEAGEPGEEGDTGEAEEGAIPTTRRAKSKKPRQNQPSGEASGSEGEGLGSDDEDEFDITQDDDYLQRYHPEMIYPDSREVELFLREYANGTKKRVSRPILSKYEATSIIGMRAQQISRGSEALVHVEETDPIEIAKIELRAKIIPVVVRRVLPNGVSEYWRLSELLYFEN
jgi:DNA-directed RNA polymerase I, II, and III subunit RPABC2